MWLGGYGMQVERWAGSCCERAGVALHLAVSLPATSPGLQVRRQPWKQPSLVPPHAVAAEQRAAAAAGAGGAAPAASISTSALLRWVGLAVRQAGQQ